MVDLQTATVIFQKAEIKVISIFLILVYPPTLNSIHFVEKNNGFVRFCLCSFESDTGKSDFQILRKMMQGKRPSSQCPNFWARPIKLNVTLPPQSKLQT